MEFALSQAVFLPLLLSPVAYIIGRKYGPNPVTWFCFGVLLYCTILVVLASLSGTYEEHYPWTAQFGEFGFLLDGLASPFAIIIYVLSTILVLYSKPYMVHLKSSQRICKQPIRSLLCIIPCLCNGNAGNCSCNKLDRILRFL